MYIPEIYKNNNSQEINQFLKANSFGILINQTQDKIWGTHIPLELTTNSEGQEVLHCHIAKENPQSKSLKNNHEVLCIFNGPNAYVSSSWYDHENVPTWNYIAVHVYGKVRILNSSETLFSLKNLVDKYEKNSKKPLKIEDLSHKTMLQARGIVGYEILITEIQAQKKLSQNRDDKNHQNIISELLQVNKNNASEIANEMKKCPMH